MAIKRKRRKNKKQYGPFPYGRVVLDYETDGLKTELGARPFIAGMEDEAGRVVIARPDQSDWNRVIKGIIEDPKIEKICHGAKFEVKMSRAMGMNPRGKWHDTMALAVLINEYQRLSLGWLSKTHFNDSSKDVVKEWLAGNATRIMEEKDRPVNYTDVPKWLLEEYLEGDLDKTWRLFFLWYETVIKNHADLYEMETELVFDIAQMEEHGLWIDTEYSHKQIKKYIPVHKELQEEMLDIAGVKFNPGSSKDLDSILPLLNIDTGVLDKRGYMKTSSDLLEPFNTNPFVKALLKWRTVHKFLHTYFIPFTQRAVGNILHGSIWQYGRDKAIVTGRLSSSDPNLQNIPNPEGRGPAKELLLEMAPACRRCIIPPPDHGFIFFDAEQIEMVIFTCLVNDRRAVSDVLKGIDPYVAQGKLLFGRHAFDGLTEKEFKRKRNIAKEICLGLIYGLGIKKLAKKLGLTVQEANDMRNRYFSASPAARDFMVKMSRDLLIDGFITDRFGRNFHVPRDLAYKAVNAECQGSAATIIKLWIIAARPLQTFGAFPVLTVHDELIMCAPLKNIKTVAIEGKRLMEAVPLPFEVPIKVGVDWSARSWTGKVPLALS